jgi:anti-sigma regulatory factor (Ser/Thr protein kinase)
MESPTVLPVHHGRAADRRRGCVIKLPPEARSVPTARAHATQVLQGWGLSELAEDAALVVSELVTNAVRASASTLHLSLSAGPGWLVVAVADAGQGCPVRYCLGNGAESGRGLRVVEALSARWGWHPVVLPGLTKVVWAEWIFQTQTPDVSRADAASRNGGEPLQGT